VQTPENDAMERLQHKQDLLKTILKQHDIENDGQLDNSTFIILTPNQGMQSPPKPMMTSIGVDTSTLLSHNSFGYRSLNSTGSRGRTLDKQERIEILKRSRSPSLSQSPLKIQKILGSSAESLKDKQKKSKELNTKQNAEKANTAIADTASHIKNHIIAEQRKLEKCIIKLSSLKALKEK
jgi:hypothetical protein